MGQIDSPSSNAGAGRSAVATQRKRGDRGLGWAYPGCCWMPLFDGVPLNLLTRDVLIS